MLAGVVALSGLAASFGRALGLGAAYVFGMVAPLFVLAVLWERRDWRASRLFRPRTFTLRVGGVRRTVSGTSVASGLLLLAMGAATVWIALAGSAMTPPDGWQARVSAWLQHAGAQVVRGLGWLPGWAAGLLLAAAVGLLGWRALRQVGWLGAAWRARADIDSEEETDERQDAQVVRPPPATRGRQA